MNKPILLNKLDLIEPIAKAQKRIEKIRVRKAQNEDNLILEGLFVLAVSSFENSITDTLKVLLNHIPYKLENKHENISKQDLLSTDLLEKVIEKKIIEQSYKNLKDFLTFFIDTTDIDIDKQTFFEGNDFEYLKEIKATRNLLIHNNLVINSSYLESAGSKARDNQLGNSLKIDKDYLYNSIVTLMNVLESFNEKLKIKYQKYTRINALRNLFNYIFETQIMEFDNEWIIDEAKDKIIDYNEEKSFYECLSTTEQMFFDIWLAHFRAIGKGRINLESSFFRLDKRNREKLGFLIKVIDLLKN